METKEMVKIEDQIILDYFGDSNERSSLGFMELLGLQDFSSTHPSIFDIFMSSASAPIDQTATAAVLQLPETSEVVNTPATPNSSSISSASSNGARNDEQATNKLLVDEEDEQQKTQKQLKVKKTSQKKKQREPRFAFMTKSEVDHLEDGYRWRKYGQKAVKNSPFPRSYYRCTTASCNVKKRVERSFSDPSIVVTTYEGQHIHPSPIMTRQTQANISPYFPQYGGAGISKLRAEMTLHHLVPQLINNLAPPMMNCGGYMNPTASLHDERRFCNTTTPAAALLEDNGLLQDIVPSIMRKD